MKADYPLRFINSGDENFIIPTSLFKIVKPFTSAS